MTDALLWLGIWSCYGWLLWTFFQVYPEAATVFTVVWALGFGGAWLVYYLVEWLDPRDSNYSCVVRQIREAARKCLKDQKPCE